MSDVYYFAKGFLVLEANGLDDVVADVSVDVDDVTDELLFLPFFTSARVAFLLEIS